MSKFKNCNYYRSEKWIQKELLWSVTKVKSKYFLLLSDDDLLMPDALENLNYILENVEDLI